VRKEEVPQDVGLAGRMREVTYAVNAEGRYEAVPSYGWDPKTVALEQAWEQIRQKLDAVRREVEAGGLSPLAWHMERHLMTPALLAGYVGLSRWRVRRHLKARVFAKLKPALRARYAAVFGIAPEDLGRLPADPGLDFLNQRE
jgi:hypothetical protein